ncbi:MAG TPA: RMD1 family protein [Chitinophagaceae bacterium]
MNRVIAYGLADSFDIKGIKSILKLDLIYSDADQLYYGTGDGRFAYIFNYGVVCFFNFNEERIIEMQKMLEPYSRNPFEKALNEEFEVETGPINVGYNKIVIPSYHPQVIRIIMFNVAQSVVLDYYSYQTDRLLEDTNYHTQMLEKRGRLGIRGNALKKYIGKTLNLKNRIAENLYVFDSPPQTWENEELDVLHQQLKRSFDLQNRFRDVSEGLGIVKENLSLFKDLLQYRNSTMLEWIIIILIAIEVLHFFWTEFFR